jgi:hypothetical protein
MDGGESNAKNVFKANDLYFWNVVHNFAGLEPGFVEPAAWRWQQKSSTSDH